MFMEERVEMENGKMERKPLSVLTQISIPESQSLALKMLLAPYSEHNHGPLTLNYTTI